MAKYKADINEYGSLDKRGSGTFSKIESGGRTYLVDDATGRRFIQGKGAHSNNYYSQGHGGNDGGEHQRVLTGVALDAPPPPPPPPPPSGGGGGSHSRPPAAPPPSASPVVPKAGEIDANTKALQDMIASLTAALAAPRASPTAPEAIAEVTEPASGIEDTILTRPYVGGLEKKKRSFLTPITV